MENLMKYNSKNFVYKSFIDKHIPQLREEVLNSDWSFAPLYPGGLEAKIDLYNKWKIIQLKNMNVYDYSNVAKYPVLNSLVDEFGEVCRSAGISILEAGGVVATHVDTETDQDKYIIVHVPIDIPDGDVGFKENNEVGKWVSGESFILDVESPHSVWNHTDKHRIVILLELLKEVAYVVQ